MKTAMIRKTELSLLIQRHTNSNCQDDRVSDGTIRYFDSFLLILRSEQNESVIRFLMAYLPLLKRKQIPFFSLNSFIKLYERWKNYPAIIRDLQFVAMQIKGFTLNEDFWSLIIRLSGANKENDDLQLSRLSLLTCMINLRVLEENDLCENTSILYAILNSNVRKKDFCKLKRNLQGENEHPYWNLFAHILLMKKNGASALEINQMIRMHHDSLSRDVLFTKENKAFIDVLYRKLPPYFMTSLYNHQIEKLRFIYQHNPSLFEEWQPEIDDKLNFYTLVKSLFREFIVSDMFIGSFSRGDMSTLEQQWFIHVLKGNNLVKAEGLPFALTKMAAHVFRCMGSYDMSVTQAIIFSGLQAQINDEFYSRAVVNSIRDFREVSFWIKTMAILHANGLPTRNVTEVMDYIGHKVFIEGGQLDIKRKKIANLLNDVHYWHRELNEESLKKKLNRRLPDAGIDNHKMEFLGAEYEITQIRKAIDLYNEGKELHHCVYTYKVHCLKRQCYIFSLKLIKEDEEKTPLITIEMRGNKVVQAKGKYNRQPNDTERKLIQLWASEKDLRVVA